ALALHELATNAAKYGALSSEAGRGNLTWRIQDGKLELSWKDTGRPQTSPPTRRGYGSRAIVAGIERQLGGIVKFDWQTNGLSFPFSVPHHTRKQSLRR